MTSHELARKLLALPNLPMSPYYEGGEPKIEEIIDSKHPDFQPCPKEIFWLDRPNPEWQAYWDSQPKKTVIGD